MKVVVVDYSGHPFQIQLSNVLAARGHDISHVYCSSFTTPKGNLNNQGSPNFSIEPIALSQTVNKTNFLKRRKSDIEFGRLLIRLVEKKQPEKIVLSNLPLDALDMVAIRCYQLGIPYIYWLQDIYHIAIAGVLKRKLPLLSTFPSLYYNHMEKRLLRNASAIVAITPDFVPLLEKWGVSKETISVIPNWAPIDELPILQKSNSWSQRLDLDQKKVVLYSGTLGFKHNPDLILDLARRINNNQSVVILIISEGPVVKYIEDKAKEENLNCIKTLPFQSFEDMPRILAAADILIGILEKTAGIFSVPSKVLTYLTAGKPIVLSVPSENLSSRIVVESNAGLSFEPHQATEFIDGIDELLGDSKICQELGKNARRYAEKHFNIVNIAAKFESILTVQ